MPCNDCSRTESCPPCPYEENEAPPEGECRLFEASGRHCLTHPGPHHTDGKCCECGVTREELAKAHPPQNAHHKCRCGHERTSHGYSSGCIGNRNLCGCQGFVCDHSRCGWKPREDEPEPRCEGCGHTEGEGCGCPPQCVCGCPRGAHMGKPQGCTAHGFHQFEQVPEPPMTPEEEEQAPEDRIHPADCVQEDGCQYMEPTCENGCKVAADELVRESCEDCLRGTHGPNAHREHRWSNPVPGTHVVCLHCCIREQDWDGESVCPGETVDDEPAPPQPERRPPLTVAYSVQGHLYEVALSGDATVRAVDGALVITHHLGPVAGIVQAAPLVSEEQA